MKKKEKNSYGSPMQDKKIFEQIDDYIVMGINLDMNQNRIHLFSAIDDVPVGMIVYLSMV